MPDTDEYLARQTLELEDENKSTCLLVVVVAPTATDSPRISQQEGPCHDPLPVVVATGASQWEEETAEDTTSIIKI